MPRPLAGVRLKLSRANHHLGVLERSIQGFLESDFYALRGEKGPNTFIYRVDRVKPTNPRWGIYVGEIIYNLRSALDHLAYELAVQNLGSPLPSDIAKTSAFPLMDSGPDFRKRKRNGQPARGSGWHKVRGMHRRARTVVERLQPYHRRKNPHLLPLLWLEQLCNVDKHRTIPLTSTQLERSRYRISGTGCRALHKIEVFRRPFKENAMIARLTVEWDEGDVDMDAEIVPDIAFDEGAPERLRRVSVLDVLYECRNVIAFEVIPKLMPFFPPRERLRVSARTNGDRELPVAPKIRQEPRLPPGIRTRRPRTP